MANNQVNSFKNPLADDLDHILKHTKPLWEQLRGQRIFITGGTGFFGCWLLESFCWANIHQDLNASAVVLTRNPEAFQKKVPHLAFNPAISLYRGNVRDFPFPKGEFSHIIHAAATSAMETYNNIDPLTKFDTTVEGTRHVLEFAVRCGAKKVLFTSSGAVYGNISDKTQNIPENFVTSSWVGIPDAAWGISKQCAEFFCEYYVNKYGLNINVARCFTFVGPYIPLNLHYAVGNFIRDALAGGPIHVHSDGTSYRSYMYSADLAIWLWTLLFKAKGFGIYNVGSEIPISIRQLAETVASLAGSNIEIKVMNKSDSSAARSYYIPSTQRAHNELGLVQIIGIEEAIRKTLRFYREQMSDQS